MSEENINPVSNPLARSLVLEKLSMTCDLVPAEKKRYKNKFNILKELLPRAVMSYANSIKIEGKGPAIIKILADNGIPCTYGSMKVFFTKARDLAEKQGITDDKEKVGIAIYIKEKVGEQAHTEIMRIAREIVDTAPKYQKQKRLRRLPPKAPESTPTIAPTEPETDSYHLGQSIKLDDSVETGSKYL